MLPTFVWRGAGDKIVLLEKDTVRVETPEGIAFSWLLASPLTRALAQAVDVAAIATATYTLSEILSVFAVAGTDWLVAARILGAFVAAMVYSIALEWRWRGQTIGKRLLRLRVVDAAGLRLRLAQVILRNLLRAVDILPVFYMFGGTVSLLSEKGQRTGDIAAGTIVIRESMPSLPDLQQLSSARYNSLMAYPYLVARLRSRVQPEAASLAVLALSRRDNYDPSARLRIFGEMAGYFRDLVRFPPEAEEGLTDEQYVRSVVLALYSGARGRA